MMELVNYMEKLVFSKLNEVLAARGDICKCEQCRLDIAAIALNNLTPRYIVTDRGKLYAKLDMMQTQFGIDILMAIGKGINTVAAHPRHEPKTGD
ncbi:MAG: late competence development ComFB family protein [Acidaminococcales bacterium]|jgi:competence protein ComFB|nr:late competence development ComFB family protein [Acidaminococcales bacterium]